MKKGITIDTSAFTNAETITYFTDEDILSDTQKVGDVAISLNLKEGYLYFEYTDYDGRTDTEYVDMNVGLLVDATPEEIEEVTLKRIEDLDLSKYPLYKLKSLRGVYMTKKVKDFIDSEESKIQINKKRELERELAYIQNKLKQIS